MFTDQEQVEETYTLVEYNDRPAVKVESVRGWSIHLAWQEGDPDGPGYALSHCEYVEGRCWLAVACFKDSKGRETFI